MEKWASGWPGRKGALSVAVEAAEREPHSLSLWPHKRESAGQRGRPSEEVALASGFELARGLCGAHEWPSALNSCGLEMSNRWATVESWAKGRALGS